MDAVKVSPSVFRKVTVWPNQGSYLRPGFHQDSKYMKGFPNQSAHWFRYAPPPAAQGTELAVEGGWFWKSGDASNWETAASLLPMQMKDVKIPKRKTRLSTLIKLTNIGLIHATGSTVCQWTVH